LLWPRVEADALIIEFCNFSSVIAVQMQIKSQFYSVQLNSVDLAQRRRWRRAKFACRNRISKRASEAVLFDYPITWLVGTNGTPSPVQNAASTNNRGQHWRYTLSFFITFIRSLAGNNGQEKCC